MNTSEPMMGGWNARYTEHAGLVVHSKEQKQGNREKAESRSDGGSEATTRRMPGLRREPCYGSRKWQKRRVSLGGVAPMQTPRVRRYCPWGNKVAGGSSLDMS